MELPNKERNKETERSIRDVHMRDPGAHADKSAGIAMATSTLNLAESVQLLQLQIIEASSEIRAQVSTSTEKFIESQKKLSESNEVLSRKMVSSTKWMVILTVVLSLAAVVQVVVSIVGAF